jgi:hypothetical protein
VSHYNIYWQKGWQKNLLGSVPAIGFLATRCTGDCAVLNTTREDPTM